MSKSSTFVDILHNIDALSDTEQKALAGKLLEILSAPQNKENLLNGGDTSKFNDDAVVVCPYCGGTHIVKKGFSDDHVPVDMSAAVVGRVFTVPRTPSSPTPTNLRRFGNSLSV